MSQFTLCLMLGSNINAPTNLKRATRLLQEQLHIVTASDVWRSEAVGSDGPAYLNAALLATTAADPATLKDVVLRPIETQLGRVRSADKFADRTIDIDLIVVDSTILDPQLWQWAHLAVPVSQLLPDLRDNDGFSLAERAEILTQNSDITRRAELSLFGGNTMFSIQDRLNHAELSPDPISILSKLEGYIIKSGIDRSLLELVKLRSSQINGCAFCIDMHTKDARSRGESEQRLYGLNAWREAPYYSPKERATLAWTEAVTKISDHSTTDELYNEMLTHFSEKELVDLTWAVIAINSWNRLAIAFHTEAGTYMPDSPVAKRG